jgi:hypothetical protein
MGNAMPFLAPPPLLTYPVRGERRGEEGSGTGIASGCGRRSREKRGRRERVVTPGESGGGGIRVLGEVGDLYAEGETGWFLGRLCWAGWTTGQVGRRGSFAERLRAWLSAKSDNFTKKLIK